MKNGDRAIWAVMGYAVGGIFGTLNIFLFVILRIDLMFWAMFTLLVCGPAVAVAAWINADKIEGWEKRT